jgi:Excalibur calcium-binding domain
MAGRQWHWIAAGVAGLAVVGAVLANDATQSAPTLSAHPFPTVQFYAPNNGGLIVATPPTMDATTVTKRTTPPPPKPSAPAPPARPSLTSVEQPPEPPSPPSVPVFPVFYPNCEMAKALGAAPIHEGEPGYRQELDRDRDGIACER